MATTMPPVTPLEELRESLERHNTAFENLLRLIPAKYYIVNEEQDVSATLFSAMYTLIRRLFTGFKVPEEPKTTKSS
jgi:60S ribosome biogenesis protein Rrp14